jgi:hypothetical protein
VWRSPRPSQYPQDLVAETEQGPSHFFKIRLSTGITKENPVPTERKQIRLILDVSTERQVIDAARKEGRSVSAMVNRLVNESLSARRSAAAEQDELLRVGSAVKLNDTLVKLLRGEDSAAQ